MVELLGMGQKEMLGVAIVAWPGRRVEVHVPSKTEQPARGDREPEDVLAHAQRDQVTTVGRHGWQGEHRGPAHAVSVGRTTGRASATLPAVDGAGVIHKDRRVRFPLVELR